ncbi:MAG: carboxypeptidase-like regulatory domain-containing protein, partial [Pyrinomonadaceae bacterium]
VAPNAPPPTVFTYPVGTAAGMFEVQVTPTVTSGGSLTIQNFDGNPAPTGAGTTLQRFWTTSSGGGITADVKFFYHATGTPGTVANYRELRVVPVNQVQSFPNGAPCPGAGSPCVDNTAKTIFVAGASSFNANWTAGEPLGTTAAMVGVSGRVLTADGIAIRGVRVTLDDGTGHPISATSNAFGYYHFDAVQSGGTFMLNATSRGYTFSPRVVSVTDQLTGLDLTALP